MRYEIGCQLGRDQWRIKSHKSHSQTLGCGEAATVAHLHQLDGEQRHKGLRKVSALKDIPTSRLAQSPSAQVEARVTE